MSPSEKRIEEAKRWNGRHEMKISTLIKTVNKLRKEITALKADDQVNIKLINQQNAIDKLQREVLQLQEVEDLRDKQMKVLETVINKQIKFIKDHVN